MRLFFNWHTVGESGHSSFHPEGWAQVGKPGPRNVHKDFVGSNWKLAGVGIDQAGEIQDPETR